MVPSELILKAAIPVALPEQVGLALRIVYAYAPAGSITIEEGKPFNTQVWFAVSLGVLASAATWPLFKLKLKVSRSPRTLASHH